MVTVKVSGMPPTKLNAGSRTTATMSPAGSRPVQVTGNWGTLFTDQLSTISVMSTRSLLYMLMLRGICAGQKLDVDGEAKTETSASAGCAYALFSSSDRKQKI